jgi:transposase-like protein
MSTRDIRDHLAEVYGAQVSAATVSRVTDVVAEEVAAWQSRPVDAVYPILYIDAIVIKVRDSGVVANKAAHLVVGVDVEGERQQQLQRIEQEGDVGACVGDEVGVGGADRHQAPGVAIDRLDDLIHL